MKGWKGLLWMLIPFVLCGGLLAVLFWIPSASAPRFVGPAHYLRLFLHDSVFWIALRNTLLLPASFSIVLLGGFCALRAFLRRRSLHQRFNKLFFGAAFTVFTGGVYLPLFFVGLTLSAASAVDILEVFAPPKPVVIQLPLLLCSVMISCFFCFIIWLVDRLLLRKITPAAGE